MYSIFFFCSCPTTGFQPQQPLTTAFKQQNLGMNNMVKFMLKRGLVNDLARIPHSLDMSSPLMAFTVNAALKPLEALSRIVNLPPAAPIAGRPVAKPKTDDGEQQEISTQQQGTSISDTTRAQVTFIHIHLIFYLTFINTDHCFHRPQKSAMRLMLKIRNKTFQLLVKA